MAAALTSLLAHQGGWDEFLLVATPVVLMALLLRLANRRAERQLSEQPDEQSDEQSDAQPNDSTSAPIDTSRPTKSS